MLQKGSPMCMNPSETGVLKSLSSEFIELPSHPFWVGTQAHPEFKSRPDRPAPLFAAFISAATSRAAGRNPQLIDLDEPSKIL